MYEVYNPLNSPVEICDLGPGVVIKSGRTTDLEKFFPREVILASLHLKDLQARRCLRLVRDQEESPDKVLTEEQLAQLAKLVAKELGKPNSTQDLQNVVSQLQSLVSNLENKTTIEDSKDSGPRVDEDALAKLSQKKVEQLQLESNLSEQQSEQVDTDLENDDLDEEEN